MFEHTAEAGQSKSKLHAASEATYILMLDAASPYSCLCWHSGGEKKGSREVCLYRLGVCLQLKISLPAACLKDLPR